MHNIFSRMFGRFLGLISRIFIKIIWQHCSGSIRFLYFLLYVFRLRLAELSRVGSRTENGHILVNFWPIWAIFRSFSLKILRAARIWRQIQAQHKILGRFDNKNVQICQKKLWKIALHNSCKLYQTECFHGLKDNNFYAHFKRQSTQVTSLHINCRKQPFIYIHKFLCKEYACLPFLCSLYDIQRKYA